MKPGEKAGIDELTGLLNRRSLDELMAGEEFDSYFHRFLPRFHEPYSDGGVTGPGDGTKPPDREPAGASNWTLFK